VYYLLVVNEIIKAGAFSIYFVKASAVHTLPSVADMRRIFCAGSGPAGANGFCQSKSLPWATKKAQIIGQHSYISLRFGVNEILSLDCSFVSIRAIKLN
jgi:hypothetical protein